LQQVRLTNADLADADLRRANLRDAVILQALTPAVQIEGAVLVGADFSGSGLVVGGVEPPLPPPLPLLPVQP
jgi:uncharacterized protein YjbI with pentapeptide repeats